MNTGVEREMAIPFYDNSDAWHRVRFLRLYLFH